MKFHVIQRIEYERIQGRRETMVRPWCWCHFPFRVGGSVFRRRCSYASAGDPEKHEARIGRCAEIVERAMEVGGGRPTRTTLRRRFDSRYA